VILKVNLKLIKYSETKVVKNSAHTIK